MSDTQEENFGYGDVDEVVKAQGGGGKYLNFKKGDKGRVILIRIASEPRYVNQHWADSKPLGNCTGDDCVYCGKNVKEKLDKTAKWGWTVIDREDGEVKVFTGPTQIARAIKEISELRNKKSGNLMWGNPTTYDIQIERTEQPGAGYYKVTPQLEEKGEITAEEKAKVAEANYDLMKELKGSKKSDNTGSYGSTKASMETAPDEAFNPDDIPDNLGEDEEDKMPF